MRWHALYVEFRRWRTDDVESIASSFFTGPGIDRKQHEVLPYNSKTWWACLTFLRLRNFDLVLRKHTSVAHRPPDMALGVPIVEEHADKHASDTSGSEGGRSCAASDVDVDKHAPESDSADEVDCAKKVDQ